MPLKWNQYFGVCLTVSLLIRPIEFTDMDASFEAARDAWGWSYEMSGPSLQRKQDKLVLYMAP